MTNGGSATGAPGATDGKLLAWKFGVDGSGKPDLRPGRIQRRRLRLQLELARRDLVGDHLGDRHPVGQLGRRPRVDQRPAAGLRPDPRRARHISTVLWSAPSGASVKLSEPGVGGNRVYVGRLRRYASRASARPVQSPLAGRVAGLRQHHGGPVVDPHGHLHRHHRA